MKLTSKQVMFGATGFLVTWQATNFALDYRVILSCVVSLLIAGGNPGKAIAASKKYSLTARLQPSTLTGGGLLFLCPDRTKPTISFLPETNQVSPSRWVMSSTHGFPHQWLNNNQMFSGLSTGQGTMTKAPQL